MAAFPIQIRAIAYDLDGTLVDSAGDLAYAANLMREELNLPAIPESEIKTYIGKGIANLVRRAVMRGRAADDVVSDAYVKQALAICERHYHQHMCRTTRPYPGVVAGLEAARDKGLRLACIPNKVARFTEPMLRELDLAQYFELTLSGDSLPEKKTSPCPAAARREIFQHRSEAIADGRRFRQRRRSRKSRRITGVFLSLRLSPGRQHRQPWRRCGGGRSWRSCSSSSQAIAYTCGNYYFSTRQLKRGVIVFS